MPRAIGRAGVDDDNFIGDRAALSSAAAIVGSASRAIMATDNFFPAEDSLSTVFSSRKFNGKTRQFAKTARSVAIHDGRRKSGLSRDVGILRTP